MIFGEKRTRQARRQVYDSVDILEKEFKLLRIPKDWNTPSMDNDVETFTFIVKYKELGARSKFSFLIQEIENYQSIYDSISDRRFVDVRRDFIEEVTRNIEFLLETTRDNIRNITPVLTGKGKDR